MDNETLVLGPECDNALVRRVKRALKRLGARRKAGSWGVFGSQQIGRETWTLRGRELVLEAETYMGLTLSGPGEVVRRVQSMAARGAGRSGLWALAALVILGAAIVLAIGL